MIRSMTGFSALALELDSGSLALEIRSVNNRYLDLQLRMPDELRIMEPSLRESLSAQISRGKVECRIGFTVRASANTPARINLPLLRQLAQWNAEVREILPAARELGVADILRWNGILESNALAADKLHDSINKLLQQVLPEFNASRAREGEKLKDFLLQRRSQQPRKQWQRRSQ